MRALFARPIFSIFIILLLSPITFAQNENREEEEKVLEAQRKAKIEEAIHARENEAKEIEQHPEIFEHPEQSSLVEVEPNNILPADLTSSSALIPYRFRRTETGLDVGLGFSNYVPSNFESDYISSTLKDFNGLYGAPSTPMMELYFNYKKNMAFGSIGADLGAGFFKDNVETDTGDSLSLQLQLFRLGGKVILDNFSYEPLFAPYVSGGVYTVVYKETSVGKAAHGGTTGAAFYYAAGVMMQLNWIDSASSVEAYSEAGIENTFLFLEARQYLSSADTSTDWYDNGGDPDFSTGIVFNGGLSLEF